MATRLHAVMIKMPVKFTVFFLADVTSILNDLSIQLQASDVSIFDMRQHITAT